ncbi:MAG: hypothetical protein WCL02_05495 [bacterium]
MVLGAVAIATEIKTTNLIPAGQQLSGVVVTCIKSALEKRETTLISAFTTYQNDSLTTLTTRKTALLASWDKSTKSEAKSAVSAAWKNYTSSMSALKSTLHASRDSAWSVYKNDVKVCK